MSVVIFFFFLIKVHIPCPSERQWILIVANFIDKSFDVLNPDHSDEKFKPIVTTVTNNFKNLFIKSYPGCTYFNIRDFEVRYVKTPQHNFRYSYYTTFFNFNFLQYNILSLSYEHACSCSSVQVSNYEHVCPNYELIIYLFYVFVKV